MHAHLLLVARCGARSHAWHLAAVHILSRPCLGCHLHGGDFCMDCNMCLVLRVYMRVHLRLVARRGTQLYAWHLRRCLPAPWTAFAGRMHPCILLLKPAHCCLLYCSWSSALGPCVCCACRNWQDGVASSTIVRSACSCLRGCMQWLGTSEASHIRYGRGPRATGGFAEQLGRCGMVVVRKTPLRDFWGMSGAPLRGYKCRILMSRVC
jgi:hypothetical protein